MKKILWIVCLCLVFAYSLEVNGQTTSKGDIRFFYTKNQPRKLQIIISIMDDHVYFEPDGRFVCPSLYF